MRIRPSTAPVTVLAGALLLTACGGSNPLEGKTGPEVVDMAADALEEAGAVHVSGTTTEDGEETVLDLQLQGDDAAGSITVGGTEIQLISVDGDLYVEASPDFLSAFGISAEDAAEYDGRWVAMPADAAAEFSEFSLAGIAEEFRGDDAQEETRTDELDGDDVVVVELEDGSELVVADDDPAYPRELRAGDDAEGTMTFSDFGDEQDISAPDDVVELEELAAG